ncbi:MAG: cytoplasmic protein [Desulfobulbus propionicus]|nr:MAG: cytoplasmic protein [Desulfobulbus propionicus]
MQTFFPQQNSDRPDIDYPCSWQYRVIGIDRDGLMQAVSACISKRPCEIRVGNTSSGGRYVSVILEVEVSSDEDRLTLYSQLAALAEVRMVL